MQLQDALKTIGEASYRLKKFGELSSIGSYDMTATAPKGAAKRRAELLSFVRAESRKTLLAPETLDAVETLAAHESELSPEMKGELRLYPPPDQRGDRAARDPPPAPVGPQKRHRTALD